MGRKFNQTDNDYLYTNDVSMPGYGYVYALSIWFKPTNVTGVHRICGWTGASNQISGLYLSGTSCRLLHSGTDNPTPVWIELGTITNNTWNHVYAYWSSSTLFRGRLNGGSEVSYGGYVGTLGNNSGFRVGAISSLDTQCFEGDIAEIGVWGSDLSSAEQIKLASGILPFFMKHESLEGCYPLWGGYQGTGGFEHILAGSRAAYLIPTTEANIPKSAHSPTLNINQNFLGSVLTTEGAKDISPTGIASEEAHGTPSIGNVISVPSIPSAEVLGIHSISYVIQPTGIPSEEAMGQHTVSLEKEIVVFGILSEEAMGNHFVNRGAVQLQVFGIPSEEAHGTPVISVQVLDIEPPGIPSEEAFGIPTIQLVIRPVGIPSAEALGIPTIQTGNINIAPTGIPSAEAFGDFTVQYGNINISPEGIPSAEALGTPLLTTGNIVVVPEGIVSGEAFGIPTIERGAVNITPEGIPSGEAHGSHVLSTGEVFIAPNGIPSGETFGDFTVQYGAVNIDIPSIDSAEAMGDHTIERGPVNIAIPSIESAEIHGEFIITTGPIDVAPTGIPSEEAVGTPKIDFIVYPNGIPSEEALGQPSLTTGPVNINIPSISSEEAFGAPIVRNLWVLFIPSIPSEEALGTPTIVVFEKNEFMQIMDEDIDCIFDELDEFSEEVVFMPKDASSFPIPVIFDNEFFEINTPAQASVLSRQPMVTVKDRFPRRPKRGDKMKVRGVNYAVLTYEPDGTGLAIITLEHERTN